MTEPPLLEGEPSAGEQHPGDSLQDPLLALPRLELGTRLVEALDLLFGEVEVTRLEVVLETVFLTGGAVVRSKRQLSER